MTPDQIRQLVAQGKLGRAIEALKSSLSGSDLRNEVILLESRFEKIERDDIIGVNSHSESSIGRNQLASSILQLVDKWVSDSTIVGDGSSGISIPTPSPEPERSDPTTAVEADKEPPLDQNGNLPVWIGTASLAAILGSVLFIPCPSDAQFFVFRVLLALGAAGIASIIPGYLGYKGKLIQAGGALGVLVLIYLINPATVIAEGQDRCTSDEPFTLTVSVEAQRPSSNYPSLQPEAQLLIWQNNEWRPSGINEDGVAYFRNFKSDKKKVAIRLNADFYQPETDSLAYDNDKEAVSLRLIPDGSLGKVHGKVMDQSREPLGGVRIEVAGVFQETDEAGNYALDIPLEKQEEFHQFFASKEGFTTYSDEVWPGTGRKDLILEQR